MYPIGELAKESKTTVRTLRYYDEIGLLKPSKVDARGQRFYDERCSARLQVILWLKDMGLELAAIKQLLTYEITSPKKILRKRLDMIQMEKEQLEQAEQAIHAILQVMDLEGTDNWERIADVFLQVQSQDKEAIRKLREKYFSKEELEVLNNLPIIGEDNDIMKEWTNLFKDIRSELYHGPETPKAKEYVDRWSALVYKMYQGNTKVAEKYWELIQNDQDENLGTYQMDPEIINYVNEATAFHYPDFKDKKKNEVGKKVF